MHKTLLSSTSVSLIKGDNILLSRRKDTGWMDGFLCIPGGHIELGETPRQAALRELKEELDIDLNIDDLEFVCVATRNSSTNIYIDYEFMIRGKEYNYKNNEPECCSELTWVDLNNLPEDVVPDFRDIINRAIVGKEKYLEIGF